jgi:hypothetical protein
VIYYLATPIHQDDQEEDNDWLIASIFCPIGLGENVWLTRSIALTRATADGLRPATLFSKPTPSFRFLCV